MLMARDFNRGFEIAVYARTVGIRRVVEREGVIKFPPTLSRKASVHAATSSHFRHIERNSGWVGYRRGVETAPGLGWLVVATGWGMAVAVAVYCVGWISGGHLNPAVTLGMAAIGHFPWSDVPGYIGAQMLGAVLGAVVVWLAYLPHWRETTDAASKL